MTQTLESLQDSLTQAHLTIASLTVDVKAFQEAITKTAGAEGDSATNPLVRMGYMNFSIDSDRARMDAI